MMAGTLDRVVTSVATQLMLATACTADEVSEQVLAQIVEQFDADAGLGGFLPSDASATQIGWIPVHG